MLYPMRSFLREHDGFWSERNRRSLYVGFLLLALALFVQMRGGRYAERKAVQAAPVQDILLDNLPTVNLDLIVVQGSLFVILLGAMLFVRHPRFLIFGIKAVALFIIVRATFLNLTTFGVYPSRAVFDPSLGSGPYDLINFDGNFFFSGHTGMPFLMALVFWERKGIRTFFLAVSVLFAMSVLLAHVHYSIDVFAAPFITYGIFKIAEWLFAGDYALLTKRHPRM
jgi:hypothetical protein